MLPLTTDEELTRIVTHLTSRSVGVQTLQSLQYVMAEDLPTLAPLEKRPLLAEFSRISKSKYWS